MKTNTSGSQRPPGGTSRLDHALVLAAKGFRIFPLIPNGKTPAKKHWPKIATTDPATIKTWWSERDYNIGVATGGGVVVIDYDMKPGQKGAEALRRHDFRRDLFGAPETFRVKTPNGVHAYYETPANCSIANSVSRIAEHVDVRGEGGYVVGPGSVVDGKHYEIITDAPLAPLPDFLTEAARKTSRRKHGNPNTPVVELDTADAIKRAIDYLEHDAPEAIQGAGGDNTTYKVACRVKDFGISEDQCFELLAEHWNGTKAIPSWDQDDLRRKVANAYAYGTLPPGASNPRAEFDGVVIDGVSLDDFVAYLPTHNYIYTPCREPWAAIGVDARLGKVSVTDADGATKQIRASAWLDRHRPVEQMTWAPGEPLLIRDRLVVHGGWIERPGVTIFNLYRPPQIMPGNAAEAEPWLDHLRKVYPDDADHIVKWLAHRVQRPHEKINHVLLLGGSQGIGKDTLLDPIKHAVGPWNFLEVSPQAMLGRFNGFIKSVVLRISEARDLGEFDRYKFYEHMKVYAASPPDVLRCDEKNLREHSVFNRCGLIITTNHKAGGIFLPPDDRRHFVAWSSLTKDDFISGYWNRLWHWYEEDGHRHVAAYLAEFNLAGFDAKAPPPKTPAFWDIADAGRSPEDAELADILDALGNPDAVTLAQIKDKAGLEFSNWLNERRNRASIPHRMERCGYVPYRNNNADDGLWKIKDKRQTVYVKATLSTIDERERAIRGLWG